MSHSIKGQIESIESGRATGIRLVQDRIQPLARVASRLLRDAGRKTGFIRKRLEFRSGQILIRNVKKGFFPDRETEVWYDGQLVLHFDESLRFLRVLDKTNTRQYLWLYRSGDWEQLLVEEYREFASMTLRENFDLDGELCRWFDHNTGACGKYENPICPCADYSEEEK